VLDPYRLVLLFLALIRVVCCLKIYLHKTMQMGFVFFLRMFQDKCNRDFNYYYFQCNHNWLHCDLFNSNRNQAGGSNRHRLHLCCNRPMSATKIFLIP